MKIALCIFEKFLCVIMTIIALALPFAIFLAAEWNWKLIFPFLMFSAISWALLRMSYYMMLSTNNPADRKNFFSINSRYTGRMKKSISEGGFELLNPTSDETKKQERKTKKKEKEIKIKKIRKLQTNLVICIAGIINYFFENISKKFRLFKTNQYFFTIYWFKR